MSFVSINFKFKPTKHFDAARQIWSNLTFKKLKVSLFYWIFYIFENEKYEKISVYSRNSKPERILNPFKTEAIII